MAFWREESVRSGRHTAIVKEVQLERGLSEAYKIGMPKDGNWRQMGTYRIGKDAFVGCKVMTRKPGYPRLRDQGFETNRLPLDPQTLMFGSFGPGSTPEKKQENPPPRDHQGNKFEDA